METDHESSGHDRRNTERFLERALASRDKAQASGRWIESAEVLAALERKLDEARHLAARQSRS